MRPARRFRPDGRLFPIRDHVVPGRWAWNEEEHGEGDRWRDPWNLPTGRARDRSLKWMAALQKRR